MAKIIRSATIGTSLDSFCEGVLKSLKEKGHEVIALSSPDEDLKKVGEREGVRIIGVPMERRVFFLKDLFALYQMVKVFRMEKPVIVHSMTPKAGLLCMIAAWLTRVPVRIHTFTGLVWPTATGFSRKVLMATDRITCACATHIIPEGQGVLEDLRDHGISRKFMRVLGYGNVKGVDLKLYSRRPEILEKAQILRNEKTFTFLFVGRIVGDKGINELVSAFRRLVADCLTPCRLILVGRFEMKLDPVSSETKALIERMPEISAVGSVFGDDLLAWYAASDCFVLPSYREGFPNTVLEAGALGLPSIVTDINGAREIITNDISSMKKLDASEKMDIRMNGVVIPSKDENALYNAMCWMVQNPVQRQKMSDASRALIASRYEQGFVRTQLFDFYDDVFRSL